MNLVKDWVLLTRREFAGYSRGKLIKDLLAGLTIAAVALPLALAFGVASGADAAAGLVTAIIAGVLIGIFSGAPYQISGPTGAMSAVLVVLTTRYGLEGVWLAGLMAGVMILGMAIFNLGRVVSFIPAPVITGFTSGIAFIIAFGQVDNFLGISTPAAENVLQKIAYYFQHGIQPVFPAVIAALIVMATMVIWPRFPFGNKVPGSLIGIILATLVSILAGWNMPLIGSIPRSILLDHRLEWGTIPWAHVGDLLVPAMSIAALGAIESLLCGAVAGNMTGIRMNNNVELAAQGLGNILLPFFGGVPATAAIARTSVNIKSGGITRLSSIFHGLAILAAALVLAPVIERIPLSALAGVLIITAWRMNEWHSIRFFFGKKLRHAILAFSITLAATVLLDLTQAILIGLAISSLIFLAQVSDLQVARQKVDPERLGNAGADFIHPDHSISVYYVSGPLFFAAARRLIDDIEKQDPADTTLILSMRGVPLIDATGIEVIRALWKRQSEGGGNLLFASLQPRVIHLFEKSGLLQEIGAERLFWSTDRAILSLGITLPATDEITLVESDPVN